jgi:uncharacterized tellurite resistance protein B-like protein
VSFARLVKRLKDELAEPATPEQTGHHPIRLATAAVLLEIAHADGTFSPAEDGDVTSYLRRSFDLSDDETRELMEEAAELRANTIDHFALTNFLRKSASLDERIEIVRTMWRVVYSDGKLTDYEGYLVRKLADLLGLEHRVMIDAKVSVLREREAAT